MQNQVIFFLLLLQGGTRMSWDLYENVGFHDAGTPFYIPDFSVASLPLDKKEEGLAPKNDLGQNLRKISRTMKSYIIIGMPTCNLSP